MRENTSLPKSKNVMNVARHFDHRQKINHMFVTRLICTHWKFTIPDQLVSPSKFCS